MIDDSIKNVQILFLIEKLKKILMISFCDEVFMGLVSDYVYCISFF